VTVANLTLQQMREELRVGEEFLARYNGPGRDTRAIRQPPVWNDSFGPDDLSACMKKRNARESGFAVHAHSVLRKPLPVLRVQCNHSEGQACGRRRIWVSEERDGAGQPKRFETA